MNAFSRNTSILPNSFCKGSEMSHTRHQDKEVPEIRKLREKIKTTRPSKKMQILQLGLALHVLEAAREKELDSFQNSASLRGRTILTV